PKRRELIHNTQVQQELQILLEMIAKEVARKGNPKIIELRTFLNKSFFEACQKAGAREVMSQYELQTELSKQLSQETFLQENFSLLLNNSNYWNGRKLFQDNIGKQIKPVLMKQLETVKQTIANYLLNSLVLPEQNSIINLVQEVLKIYDQIKFVEKKFTHFDINYYTYRFIYDPEISLIEGNNLLNIFTESLSYRSRFILIDEFQDTSILQWRIFQPIVNEIVSGVGQKEYGGVTVVGDEKQAIYGWRGGEKELLANIQNMVNANFETSELEISYRSKKKLIDFINSVFQKVSTYPLAKEWKYNKVSSNFSEPGYVEVFFQNRRGPENEKVISKQEVYLDFVENVIIPAGKEISLENSAILARDNKTLQEIALALEKYGIDYIIESSASLFKHKAVKNILFLLRFLCYEDALELVKFLRSDAVLIGSAKLKYFLQKLQKSWQEFWQIDDPIIQILAELASKKESLLELISSITAAFRLEEVYATEIDRKNLHQFWLVAAEFIKKNNSYPKNISGFLSYLRAMEKKEEYSQLGEASSKAIKLLTIHKSKGLQFETVFSVIDMDSGRGNSGMSLKFYYQFNSDYTRLEDYYFTYNYDKILQNCSQNQVLKHTEKREFLEEINNYYVAITRAENNLILYFNYKKKGVLKNFLEQTNEFTAEKILAQIIFNEYEFIEVNDTLCKMQMGKYLKKTNEEKEELLPIKNINSYVDLFKWEDYELNELVNIKQLETEFLQNQSVMKGNIIHYYLSQIEYDTSRARERAFKKTHARYGTLVKKQEFEKLINRVEQFLENYHEIFQPEEWDKVFNEYAVWDEQGREYRIDRLQINSQDRKILIVDYKTGYSYEEKQLQKYTNIISSIPKIRQDDYKIETKFLKVEEFIYE
ncbi:MAG: 3'-5' exonuclease, partial [Candidatus Cloacimonadota bacterium]|nr:3'-5' exonuclease [Candidatus Cloacimonadota bacterium]